MRLRSVATVTGIAAIAFALAAIPASAAPKQGPALAPATTDISSQARPRRVRQARAPTRITVRPRSYLDGGTEVVPGDRKFSDYAFPPTYTAASVLENTPSYHRSPLPGPFDLPGKNNPMQW